MNIFYYLSRLFEHVFHTLLELTKSRDKWTGILIISFFTVLIIILIYRFASNQKKLSLIKNMIKGHLLGILIYTNDIKSIFKNFFRLFSAISNYFVNSLVTFIIAVIPVILIISQIIHWYDRRPLQVEEESNLTVNMEVTYDTSNYPEIIELDVIEITEGPFHFYKEGLFLWKFRALKEGKYPIPIVVEGDTIKKEIVISSKNMPVSPLKTKRIFSLFSSWEKPILNDLPIKEIEVVYPDIEIFIGVFLMHWWLIFILGTIVFFPIMAYIFKIEI